MNEPIKVGDLVMLLWAPNREAKLYAGQIRKASNLSAHRPGEWVLEPKTIASTGQTIVWPPRYLKRIPPLSELEGEKRDEEITA